MVNRRKFFYAKFNNSLLLSSLEYILNILQRSTPPGWILLVVDLVNIYRRLLVALLQLQNNILQLI